MGREILLVIVVLLVVATFNCHGAPLEDPKALKRNSLLKKLGMELLSDPYYYRRYYKPRKCRKGKGKKKKYGGASTDSEEAGWSSWGWGGWSSDDE